MPNPLARYLTDRIATAGSLRALSAELGLSKSHLCRVAKGARPGARLLRLLGWTETITYAPRTVPSDQPDAPLAGDASPDSTPGPDPA